MFTYGIAGGVDLACDTVQAMPEFPEADVPRFVEEKTLLLPQEADHPRNLSGEDLPAGKFGEISVHGESCTLVVERLGLSYGGGM